MTNPGVFALKAQLPEQGRTNQVMAATSQLNVVLKTYASDGENELHAHTNEDHLFVVMQGSATFSGPGDEYRVVSLHEGVVLPRGVRFASVRSLTPPRTPWLGWMKGSGL